MDRAGADEYTRVRLLSLRRERAAVLLRATGRGFLHELIPLPSREALQNGSVPMDLPGLSVAYTPEAFAAHVKNVLALMEELPQYRFFPLPAPVFPEMRVLIADGTASVVRLRPPGAGRALLPSGALPRLRFLRRGPAFPVQAGPAGRKTGNGTISVKDL